MQYFLPAISIISIPDINKKGRKVTEKNTALIETNDGMYVSINTGENDYDNTINGTCNNGTVDLSASLVKYG